MSSGNAIKQSENAMTVKPPQPVAPSAPQQEPWKISRRIWWLSIYTSLRSVHAELEFLKLGGVSWISALITWLKRLVSSVWSLRSTLTGTSVNAVGLRRNKLTSCGGGGVSEGLAATGNGGGAIGITVCFDWLIRYSVPMRAIVTTISVMPHITKSLEKPALLLYFTVLSRQLMFYCPDRAEGTDWLTEET